MNVLLSTESGEMGALAADTIGSILDRALGTANISSYAEAGEPLGWDSLAKAGWDLVGIVDDGEGATLRDLVEVAQVWGSRLAPLPYLETVLAKRHSEAAQEWEGPVTFALPHPSIEQGLSYIPHGTMPGIGLLTAMGIRAGEVVPVPAGRPHILDLDARAIEASASTVFSLEAAQEVAVVFAASSVGAARQLLNLGIAFAKEREQFGKPIGSFQAVKHHLANAMIAVEEADTAVIWGSLLLEESFRTSRFAVSRCIDAAETVLQVHGGLGFTWELGLHFYLRHMMAVRESVEGLQAQF
ncbi:acyl-CoA dehydrogenase family protein [Leucobacter sp. Z1108]|uniref:acyl-CoA dehydrogenase family protein n=1 Tax=Leucobacter sp. Z1108 TaxID=3439066 RepID=UPI003F3922B3